MCVCVCVCVCVCQILPRSSVSIKLFWRAELHLVGAGETQINTVAFSGIVLVLLSVKPLRVYIEQKSLFNRDPNDTISTSADDPSLCFLTFTGRLREAVVKTNAALSALISIYAVLQTGITRALRTWKHFRLKFVHHAPPYHLR